MLLVGDDVDSPTGETLKSGKPKTISQVLDSAVFPGVIGGPLMHVVAAKAVAFGEALEPAFADYARRVVENAQAMAASFVARGYGVVSGGTDNHLCLIDLRSKGLTGKQAEALLGEAEITVNKNMVPFDPESPFVTSGIRVGSPAMTTRGLGPDDFRAVVALVDRVLSNPDDEGERVAVRREVHALCEAFPLYHPEDVGLALGSRG